MSRINSYSEQIRGVSYKPEDVVDTLDDTSIVLLRANNIRDGQINFDDVVYIKKNKVSDKQMLRKGDILICASSGSKDLVGKAAQVKDDINCTFGAFCKVIRPKEIHNGFLGMYFQSNKYRRTISQASAGANINNIKNEDIDSLELDVPSDDKQEEIYEVLSKLDNVIYARKKELLELDNLIKSRFVEMFGDPLINSLGLDTMPMTEVCEIIDGDRGKKYPTADEFSNEGFCLFLNAKNVTSSGFNFDNCMFISKEKDDALRKGKLSRGDVVLTTRGTLGNLAFYTDEIPFEHVRINSGMVILRMKQEVLNEVYFIEQFKMQLADIKEKIASGSAQPQLPISTMNKIQILIPSIEFQKQFANFVRQVTKLKFEVQKSLDETQVLMNSLMQEYFG